jgi:uncharacterized damage-inducible protein DinB
LEPILAVLFRHNLWANQRTLDACAGVDDAVLNATVDGTYGTIRDTLVHLLAAESRYLGAFTGEQPDSPLAETNPFPGFDALREYANASGEALIAEATSSPADRILTGTYRGQPYEMPAAVLFSHALDHSVEHRTHIETILTQQGIDPPDTDGIAYWREAGSS